MQVVKAVDTNLDRNIIKTHAAEKKSRQTINKLVRFSDMSKQEAFNTVAELKTNDSTPAKNTRSKVKPSEIKIIKEVEFIIHPKACKDRSHNSLRR